MLTWFLHAEKWPRNSVSVRIALSPIFRITQKSRGSWMLRKTEVDSRTLVHCACCCCPPNRRTHGLLKFSISVLQCHVVSKTPLCTCHSPQGFDVLLIDSHSCPAVPQNPRPTSQHRHRLTQTLKGTLGELPSMHLMSIDFHKRLPSSSLCFWPCKPLHRV